MYLECCLRIREFEEAGAKKIEKKKEETGKFLPTSFLLLYICFVLNTLHYLDSKRGE